MRCRIAWVAPVFIALALLPARAATLEPLSGVVSLNDGKGYKPIVWPVTVKPNNAVMVAPGGSAWLVYNDDCRIKVLPGSVYTVADEIPCKPVDVEVAPSDLAPPQVNPYLVAGAAVAGGVGVGILLSEHGKSHPASP